MIGNGYGNSSFLGTHGILARTASGGGVDPDAQAFITAAAITNPTQQAAINTLVVDLKGYSIWTKIKALYPFVGGTSTSNSYNLKNTSQYQITWSGGVTHSSNGVTFNGTNGYGNTGLNQLSVLTQNSQHISFYSRTNTDGNFGEIGVRSVATAYTMLQVKYSNTFVVPINEFYNFADNSANANGQGFYVGNRTGATLRNNWKNGSKVHTSSSASQTQANFNFFVGALNNAGSAAAYTNKQCAFASIGDGLTDTEASNFYTAVQAFQTTLGRQV
jgi:hypothetical protein